MVAPTVHYGALPMTEPENVPEVPQYGYQVPSYAYPAQPPEAPQDPLVTAPGEGFSGWWSRLTRTVRRSWRSIVAISLLTYGVPLAVLSTAAGLLSPKVTTTT